MIDVYQLAKPQKRLSSRYWARRTNKPIPRTTALARSHLPTIQNAIAKQKPTVKISSFPQKQKFGSFFKMNANWTSVKSPKVPNPWAHQIA
jgi:hypothetical protein